MRITHTLQPKKRSILTASETAANAKKNRVRYKTILRLLRMYPMLYASALSTTPT